MGVTGYERGPITISIPYLPLEIIFLVCHRIHHTGGDYVPAVCHYIISNDFFTRLRRWHS